jgi:hypothetical protein
VWSISVLVFWKVITLSEDSRKKNSDCLSPLDLKPNLHMYKYWNFDYQRISMLKFNLIKQQRNIMAKDHNILTI